LIFCPITYYLVFFGIFILITSATLCEATSSLVLFLQLTLPETPNNHQISNMGFWSSLVSDARAAVHVVVTVAPAIEDVAEVVATVAEIAAAGQSLGVDDATVVERLYTNMDLASKLLLERATKAIGVISDADADITDITPSTLQSWTGIVARRRILTKKEAEARAHGSRLAGPSATGLMYNDMSNFLTQIGAPLSGIYSQGEQARDNVKYAIDELFKDDVEVDKVNPVIQTPTVWLNDTEGKRNLKLAHSSYNMKLDQTGQNDISHSVIAHAKVKMSESELNRERKERLRKSGKGVPKVHTPATVPGYGVVVNVTTHTVASAQPLSDSLTQLGTKLAWTLTQNVVSGNGITLNVLTENPPTGVHEDILDWVTGRLDVESLATPAGNDLAQITIQSSIPTLVPAESKVARKCTCGDGA
jgi:hypothetical protein